LNDDEPELLRERFFIIELFSPLDVPLEFIDEGFFFIRYW
jgi:hypothetical protein